jgi:hypothetical protein
VLAYLNGADDAVGLIVAELGGRHDCIGRLAALYLGAYAGSLVHIAGSADAAMKAVERGLIEDIDDQQG